MGVRREHVKSNRNSSLGMGAGFAYAPLKITVIQIEQ